MNPKRRSQVIARDRQQCQRCGLSLAGRPYSIHHRQGRHCGNPDGMANLVLLCGSGTTGCHGYVHQHPAESYKAGFMIHRNGLDTPEQVPMSTRFGLVLLTDTGEALKATNREAI